MTLHEKVEAFLKPMVDNIDNVYIELLEYDSCTITSLSFCHVPNYGDMTVSFSEEKESEALKDRWPWVVTIHMIDDDCVYRGDGETLKEAVTSLQDSIKRRIRLLEAKVDIFYCFNNKLSNAKHELNTVVKE